MFHYVHPKTKEPLLCEGSWLIAKQSDSRFPLEGDIPYFLNEQDLEGINGRYERLYNRIAPFYDICQKIFTPLLTWRSERAFRLDVLSEIPIQSGDKVLEVSVGTGGNFKYLPTSAFYYGIDPSHGMLKQCKKNLQRKNLTAHLCLGVAENLPYPDNFFDVVYHVGGINFFNDKGLAVKEMIRVAKPGKILLVADETEKIGRLGEKIPGARMFYRGQEDNLYKPPLSVLPSEAELLKSDILFNGKMFRLVLKKIAL